MTENDKILPIVNEQTVDRTTEAYRTCMVAKQDNLTSFRSPSTVLVHWSRKRLT